MANEPIFNVATFDCKNKLCSAQAAVEARLLPYAGVTIAKVLSFSAESSVFATDVFTGEARVSGRVIFRVLFLDGNGACRSMETAAEFTDKITGDGIAAGSRPQILSRVLDTDILNVAADEIKLAAVVETDLLDNISTRLKYLQSAGDEVFIRTEKTQITKLAASVKDSITVSGEVAVQGDKILLTESRAVVHKRVAGTGNIAAGGEIITDILTEKEGEVFSYRTVVPFYNECAAEGCTPDCFCDIAARLIKTVATLLTDGESAAVGLEFDIEFLGHAYRTEEITPVTDAFSVAHELIVSSSEIDAANSMTARTVFEKVEGAVTLAADMPAADRILYSAGQRLTVTNTYINEGGRLVFEGMVNSSIIYFSAETGSKNSVDTELPFSIVTSESMDGKISCAYGEVIELNCKIRRGNEIDIRAEIAVFVSSLTTERVKIITDLTVGAPIEIPAAAMSLHIARPAESLWDVAKALRTTPELIMVQNPDLALPLSGGERVMVYRHLKR